MSTSLWGRHPTPRDHSRTYVLGSNSRTHFDRRRAVCIVVDQNSCPRTDALVIVVVPMSLTLPPSHYASQAMQTH